MSERGQRDIHQQTKILQEGKFSESVNSFADMLALLSEKKKHPKGSKDKR